MLAPVVDDVFVDLVREHPCAELTAERDNFLELFAREHFSRRIGWRADDDRFRFRRERRAQLIEIDRPVGRMQRHESRHEAEDGERVEVIAVVRLEKDDLIAGVQRGHRRVEKGAARADCHHDLFRRIGFQSVVVLEFFRDPFAQKIDAFEFRIRRFVRGDRIACAFHELGNRGQIANALAEVDAADGVAFARHTADVRLHEATQAVADLVHRLASVNAFRSSSGIARSASSSAAMSMSSG